MKKLIAIIMAAVLVLGLCACGASGGNSKDITGRYDLVSMEQMGVSIDVADYLEQMGLEVEAYLELKADGAAVLCFGETLDLCYADGLMWPAEDPEDTAPFTIDGNTLTLSQNGIEMVFEKK